MRRQRRKRDRQKDRHRQRLLIRCFLGTSPGTFGFQQNLCVCVCVVMCVRKRETHTQTQKRKKTWHAREREKENIHVCIRANNYMMSSRNATSEENRERNTARGSARDFCQGCSSVREKQSFPHLFNCVFLHF